MVIPCLGMVAEAWSFVPTPFREAAKQAPIVVAAKCIPTDASVHGLNVLEVLKGDYRKRSSNFLRVGSSSFIHRSEMSIW
jgi:hypothetical protein